MKPCDKSFLGRQAIQPNQGSPRQPGQDNLRPPGQDSPRRSRPFFSSEKLVPNKYNFYCFLGSGVASDQLKY